MDQELKQRLIGVTVITALAVIFVPMLFDDPVEESEQMVNELTLPAAPIEAFDETARQLPAAPVEQEQWNEANVIEEEGDVVEDFEAIEEELAMESQALPEQPVKKPEFEPEPDIAEPAFEPEPFVEEPVYQAASAPEPVSVAKTPVSERAPVAITPKPVVEKVTVKPTPLVNNQTANASNDGVSAWLIQLGSFGQKDNAFALRNKLIDQGFPASIDEAHVGNSKSYRLVVGPVRDKNRAQSMQAQLDQQNGTKSLLMPLNPADTTVASSSAPKATPTSSPARLGLMRWYIQLGSFSQRDNAYALRDKLRSQGLPASIDEVAIAGGKAYRLRVGPELDKKRAEAMQAQLVKQNYQNSLLVSE